MEKECLVFDTNALLFLYSYTVSTCQAIIDAIESKFPAIIIPPRVNEEYLRHYKESRSETGQVNILSSFDRRVTAAKRDMLNGLAQIDKDKSYQAFDIDVSEDLNTLNVSIENGIQAIQTKIKACKKTVDTEYTDDDDPVYAFFTRHCLPDTPIAEITSQCLEAKKRFTLNMKPGLTDSLKPPYPDDPFRPYGDVLVWFFVLSLGQKYSSVIFVENEIKDDWWAKPGEYIIDPFLKKEYTNSNPDSCINFVRLETFLEEKIKEHIPPEAISELEKRATSYRKALEFSSVAPLIESQLLYQGISDYGFIFGESVGGCSIDDFDEEEIISVRVIKGSLSVESEPDSSPLTFRCKARYRIRGDVTRYVSREYDDFWGVTFTIDFVVFGTAKMNFGKDVALLIDDCSLSDPGNFAVIKEVPPEEDDEEGVEENNAENYCPICSKPLTFENDAGNGYCKECAAKHDK